MSIFEEMADAEKDVSGVASDKELSGLREKAQELVEKEKAKKEAESTLKELNKEIYELQMTTLPSIMTELGMDRYGLAEAGVDIILGDYAKANIAADWEDEKREEGFAHLEELGVADIIRTEVSFSFGRDQYAHAVTLVAMLNLMAERIEEFGGTEIPVPSIKKSVPWNTLTATVKELLKKGEVVNLEKLGATVGNIVKIKERK